MNMVKGIVDSRTFWATIVDADSDAVRVGPWRCAGVNDAWVCLDDGADYPNGETFGTRQDAVDWMVAQLTAETPGKPEVPEVPEAEAAHSCGGPVFGRLTPGCPRCDELQAGAAPRQGWSRRSRYDGGGYGRHSCRESRCGPICTWGDW